TGRLHEPYGPTSPPFLQGLDSYYLINYTYFCRDANGTSVDNFKRDPEYLSIVGDPTHLYTGGFNAPYTYPDLNNMALAAVQGDGTVLLPSFHRPYLFGALFNAADPLNQPSNQNWVNGIGKYLLLRPRPVDQLSPADIQAA